MSARPCHNQPKARSCAFRFDLTPVRRIVIALLLTVAGLACNLMQAQEFRATLSGTVTDSTGAVVPGATVVVKETQTGAINRTLSDSSGQYVVPFLSPGDYSITASGPGFQTVTRAGITLQSQEHPIVNLTLTVGQATETVTVTTDAP